MIKVMIIDDSAVVRNTLTQILSLEPDIQVISTATDPYAAVSKLQQMAPDVIILDIEMPRMDGLTFLKKLMDQHPLPVIICSSKVEDHSQNALHALMLGAVDIIRKPQLGTRQFLEDSAVVIADCVRAARGARLNRMVVSPKLTADAVLPSTNYQMSIDTTDKVIVMGASTGGTEALRYVLESLPGDAPGIVIVQHMPEKFTASFAERLNKTCRMTVKEAEDEDSVLRGRVLIAPGNRHTLLKRSGARYHVEVRNGPLVCRHRPSVDVLFRSTARYAGKNALGIIMTGMGDDGARGLLEVRNAGGWTAAQDEESCVVFGMPGEAVKLHAVDNLTKLEDIPRLIINRARSDG